MDLRQLKTFVHVAELLSFTKAAALLRISQPALSRQIGLLEHELKTKLFHRHGHGIVLTEDGRIFLERSVRLLTEVESIRQHFQARGTSSAPSGAVALGVPHTVSALISHSLLAKCRSRYPGISLRIAIGFGHLLDQWVLSNSIDLAVLRGKNPSPALSSTHLLEEDLFAIAARSVEKKPRKRISPTELSKLPLIMPHEPHLIRTLSKQAGVKSTNVIEVDAFSVMIDLVREGQGYAILPVAPLMSYISTGELVAIAIERPKISWSYFICHSSVRPLGPATEAIVELVRSEIGETVEQGRWKARMVDPF
jgi:LysR family nitrogen assimilation transcriptional regulator